MSKINDEVKTLKHPASHFVSWAPQKGELSYWDREKADNRSVPLPYKFKVVHQGYTVKGFGKEGGLFSNHILSLSDDLLSIGATKDKKYKSLFQFEKWADIKDEVKTLGGRLTIQLFVVDDLTPTIKVIEINGASLQSWFTFQKETSTQHADEPIQFDREVIEIATGTTHRPVLTIAEDFKTKLSWDDGRKLTNTYLRSYLQEQLAKFRAYSNGGSLSTPTHQASVGDELNQLREAFRTEAKEPVAKTDIQPKKAKEASDDGLPF